ncbi:MAG: hypothetical protein WKF55_14350 [Gemmatimonadaceae bacterium]
MFTIGPLYDIAIYGTPAMALGTLVGYIRTIPKKASPPEANPE